MKPCPTCHKPTYSDGLCSDCAENPSDATPRTDTEQGQHLSLSHEPFSRADLNRVYDFARTLERELFSIQGDRRAYQDKDTQQTPALATVAREASNYYWATRNNLSRIILSALQHVTQTLREERDTWKRRAEEKVKPIRVTVCAKEVERPVTLVSEASQANLLKQAYLEIVTPTSETRNRTQAKGEFNPPFIIVRNRNLFAAQVQDTEVAGCSNILYQGTEVGAEWVCAALNAQTKLEREKPSSICGATLTCHNDSPHTLIQEPDGWIFRNNRIAVLGHSGHHPTAEEAIRVAKMVPGTEVTVW